MAPQDHKGLRVQLVLLVLRVRKEMLDRKDPLVLLVLLDLLALLVLREEKVSLVLKEKKVKRVLLDLRVRKVLKEILELKDPLVLKAPRVTLGLKDLLDQLDRKEERVSLE